MISANYLEPNLANGLRPILRFSILSSLPVWYISPMLTEEKIAGFKARLEREKADVEGHLSKLGSRNPANPADWVPSNVSGDEAGADRNENADIVEAMHDNNAALNQLEGRLNNIILALEKIEKGEYGVCEVSGTPIEIERLEANPAARTCMAHMDAQLS